MKAQSSINERRVICEHTHFLLDALPADNCMLGQTESRKYRRDWSSDGLIFLETATLRPPAFSLMKCDAEKILSSHSIIFFVPQPPPSAQTKKSKCRREKHCIECHQYFSLNS
jgi:hypothetical protein